MISVGSELSASAVTVAAVAKDQKIIKQIEDIIDVCVHALRQGNKLVWAGNGGSAADAQHFAAELVGRFYIERSGLSSIALNTDTSMLTAIGNDYGFDQVFSRQLDANASEGDVFIAFSTSGTSKNIIRGIKHCQQSGIISVGLAGGAGGDMIGLCDHCIIAPSDSTPRIQEAHTVIGHAICAGIEHKMFGSKEP